MRWWDELILRLRTLFRRARVERELDDEMQFHLEQQIAENVAAGMSPREAQFAALRTIGGVAQLKEECRDARRLNPLDDLQRDFRYAARSLGRSPGFTAIAVLTLALGIGANTAIFSIVNGVLLQALPYRDPERIVALNTRFVKEGREIPRLTGGDLVDLLGSHTFEALSPYFGGEVGVQLRDSAEFTNTCWVMPDFARVFGVAPAYGRLLGDGDADQGALVSLGFARRMFGDPAEAVGRTLSVEGRTYDIAGVLPAGFGFPQKTDVWLAMPKAPANLNRTAYNYRAVARMMPGTTPAAAQAQLETIGSRLAAAYPDSNRGKRFTAVPLRDHLVGDIRPTLYILMGAVSLVLLIACANVANLLLARATTRSREIALRVALGASRSRIARQLMVESAVLSLAGGALGLLLAYGGTAALIQIAPENLPRLGEVHVDRLVLTFASAVSLLASFLFGLAPAWQATRAGLNEALKQGGSRGALGAGSHRLRTALVAAEIAISFVLAIGAGLLFRSFMALNAVELGYRSDGMLVMYAHAPARTLDQYIEVTRFFDRLMPELASLPGVKSAAAAMGLPAGRYGSNGYFSIEGRPARESDREQHAGFSLSGPGYFTTMGMRLLRGRDFNARDRYDSPFVAIVSQDLVRRSFPGEDPIGKRIQCGLDAPEKWMTIAGVVSDVRESPATAPHPEIYMPLAQHPYFANEVEVVLRTAVEPGSLAGAVRRKVRERNAAVAMSFTTMETMLAESTATPRFRAFLIGTFAGLALLLAMAGVYGVMAYATAQRTSEFGVRMALGAAPGELFRMVLWRAAALAAGALSLGFVASIAAGRLVQGMLFGLRPVDALTYGTTIAAVASVVLVAAAVPALRAARVDPASVLRRD